MDAEYLKYSFAFDEKMTRKKSVEDYNAEIRRLVNEFDELGLDVRALHFVEI